MSNDTLIDSSVPLQPTTASYPFDKTNTDIILRTSDNVDFHVFSQILIAASPFFESMFEIPQPSLDQQQLKYGRPIVDVSESSKALDPLLRICYPINNPKKRSFEEIELAFRAAMKFEMELPTTVLTKELEERAPDHPLEVWAIACRLRLESVAECAAKNVSFGLTDFAVLKDMEGITAADYFRLREYLRLWHRVPKGFKFLSPTASLDISVGPPSAMANLSLADEPPPDIVCRSVDGVEFRAHKTVLSLASPVLQEKVSSASPPPAEGDLSSELALPVMQFQEGSVVLLAILELSYRSPADVTLPKDLADLTAVLVTLEKYSLKSALPVVWSFWQAIASADPLRAYCYAIRAGHEVGAKEAASCALNQVVNGVYVDELECTPALAYRRLLQYHEKCREVAEEELTKISDSLKVSSKSAAIPLPDPLPTPVQVEPVAKKWRKIKKATGSDLAPDGSWLLRYVRKLSSRLQSRPGSATPTLAELFTEATKAIWSVDNDLRVWCEDCQIVAEEIIEVDKALQQLPKGLSEVELEI